LLKQDYKDDISIEDAVALVLKVMSKTMDSTTLGSEKRKPRPHHALLRWLTQSPVEFATLTVDPTTKMPKSKIYRPVEVDALLKKHDLAKKDEDTEMKTA